MWFVCLTTSKRHDGTLRNRRNWLPFIPALTREGELPDQTNIEALASLCFTVLAGLTIRVLDGASAALLLRSIELFVNTLGFTPRIPRSSAGERKSLRKEAT